MAKWVCPVCGYVYEGENPPEKCPQSFAHADAVSAYACTDEGLLTEDHVNMAIQRNALRATAGLPVVPHFSTGWDPTPRIERPTPWTNNGYPVRPYAPKLSRADWLDEAAKLRRWIEQHPAVCPTGHVVAFAWNEFEEGGWICPNVGADGRPDTTRVASFRAVAEALKKAGGEAKKGILEQ